MRAPWARKRMFSCCRPAQMEQLLDDSDQLLLVPGLLHVVAGPLLDQLDRRLERAPGGEDHDRQVGVQVPQRAEQSDATFAGRVVLREVHVLDDDPDVLAGDQIQRFVGACRRQRLEVVQLEEDLEGFADRGLIVDDEDLHWREHNQTRPLTA